MDIRTGGLLITQPVKEPKHIIYFCSCSLERNKKALPEHVTDVSVQCFFLFQKERKQNYDKKQTTEYKI